MGKDFHQMDEMQEVVNETPVEITTETESTPVEQTTETQVEAPVSESADNKVSPSVPYDRFKEVNDELRAIKEMLSSQGQVQEQQYQPEVPELDPEAARAVDYRAEQRARAIYEQQEQAKFEAKHAKDLDDKLLYAAYTVEVRDEMAKGRYVDREAALERAKSALEARVKPVVQAAKQEGLKEGQDIAKTKQQLSAVGETGPQPQIDESKLSAAEFAKLYNIPRAN